MSEKIFACFLRLYPSQFRQKYRDEALQLYRDLSREESGPLQKMRLWIRLLTDLVAGLPLAYRNIYVAPAASPVAHEAQGMPTFRLLEQEPLRPGLFLFGSVLTLALLGVFSIVLRHPATYPVWDESSVSRSPIEAVLERLNRATSSAQPGNDSPQMDGAALEQQRTGDARKADSPAAPQGAAATQKAVNSSQARPISQPIAGSQGAQPSRLQGSKNAQQTMPPTESRGASRTTAGGGSSVASLMLDSQRTTRDAQQPVAYQSEPNASRSGFSALAISPARTAAKQQDCPFEKIAVLPHNIGYFKLDSFPGPATCGVSAEEAMTRLNEASAVIVDLRGNRGEDPGSLEQIAAWLLDRPTAWNNPRERSRAQGRTLLPMRESRLGNKPVYILTSSLTGDGAEQFANNLKMMKRATVVGERTSGSEFSRPNRQGTGVAPDVGVKASDALQIAEESARAKIGRE